MSDVREQRRGDVLRAKYGQPDRVDTAAALRLAGLRGEVHPQDAIAFTYPSDEAAEAFATANRDAGLSVTRVSTEAGPVNVIDLRSALSHVTNPTEPDA